MRGRKLAVLSLLLLVAAMPASGQKGKRKKAVPPPAAAGEYKPNTDQVTVVKGDTLWDISTRVTGSPWHWPRIWSYNPELTNPHWIYPGDVVRFQPSDLPLPKVAQLVSGQRELPTETPAEPEASKDEATSESAPVVQEVRGGLLPPEHARRPRRLVNLFVSRNELAESGVLSNALPDKLLLSPSDEVFITFPDRKRPSSGQRYMVYRTVEEVRHPVTHDKYGYLTQVTGFASVRAGDNDVSRAVITEAVTEIERGQLVAPLAQLPLADQRPTNAKVPLSGVVLALEPGPSLVGERQVLFIDIGAGRGLEVGNKLAVYVDEDPVAPDRKLPLTPVAVLVAIDVRDQATTCLVLDARRELRPGMQVKTLMH
jgi:hypothetical protein